MFFEEAAEIVRFMVRAFLHILPYLALSVPLGIAARKSSAADQIRLLLTKNRLVAIAAATAIGAVSPFCSCGVVPVVATLLGSGVPLAPVMAFWLASPSMDPEIFALSVGAVGWTLAVWRLAATFVISMAGGFLVMLLEDRGLLTRDALRGGAISAEAREGADPVPSLAASAGAPSAELACCAAGNASSRISGSPACIAAGKSCACRAPEGASDYLAARLRPAAAAGFVVGFAADFVSEFAKLAKLLALAFFLEALIVRYLPIGLVSTALGKDSVWSVPLAVALGVPLYVTNVSALGIVSGLLGAGMDGGAALAFLIGGAITTVPAMAAVWVLVRPRVFAVYVGAAALGSLLAGWIFDLVVR